VEGPRTVAELLDAGLMPETVIVPESDMDAEAVVAVERRVGRDAEWLVVRDHAFERLAPSKTPQPMVALVARPEGALPALGDDAVVLVLADVGDPGNVGTLMRSAAAVGADAVVVVGGADPWGPKVMRSSAGSLLRVPVVAYGDIDDALDALREAGLRIVGTDVRAGEPHDGGVMVPPVAIVMGNEPHGLGGDLAVDEWAHIAMPGRTESLNVAMAGTLLLFEARRG
ncbi:MAG: RNA methyltransferase, partial [Actinomycetota bacterium]